MTIQLTERNTITAAPRKREKAKLTSLQLNVISWLAPLGFLLIWEAGSRLGLISPQVMPAPSAVAATGWRLIANGLLFQHLGASLARAAVGFAIGGSIGFALGVLVGFSRLAEAVLDRSIQMIRAIPFLAMLPLVIVWFGVDETGKIFMVSLAVMFPIYINTVLGIRQVDPKLLELARVTGLSWKATIRRIILPGAMPSILTGVRYALAVAWLALVIAETIATTRGIGFLAMDAREFLQTNVIVLTILIYAAIGVGADSLARLLERQLLRWHPNYAKES
ncbi:ABC transporter permease subunit [Paracoccus laeviglucosivorans]|uniref:Sulfonate transport system permease protein n=1 Tax=Paracoccus laeviglucosivorans TaxID=1197861 RepID=A0A521FKR7_9RHOB|nr:ABC transporter permease subunit [Paracoccus laeviglucosivorans]SMO96726.1 sulfonate transport system permease protein [Paracoccus laeviglucosivorans]